MARTTLPKTLEPYQWRRFFDAIRTDSWTGVRNKALLLLMYRSGIRVGEALNLKLEDVLLEPERKLKVDGKTGQGVVPLPESAEMDQALIRWLELRGDEPGYFFVSHRGHKLTRVAVGKVMRRYSTRAFGGRYVVKSGNKDWEPEVKVHPHMLRHSCATEMLSEGVPMIGVQEFLRHANLSTTVNQYAHSVPRHAQEAARMRKLD